MKYTKLFNNHNEYAAYVNSTNFVSPNVFWCIQEGEGHCTPSSQVHCQEQHTYALHGTPSYPSQVEADAVSFTITYGYSDNYTAETCSTSVTYGETSGTVNIEPNQTSSARTISGIYHDSTRNIDVPYELTQKGANPYVWVRLTSDFSRTVPIYKVGILNNAKNSQQNGGRMMFGSTPNACPTTAGLSYTSRIYVNNYEKSNTAAIKRGTCSENTYDSGWQTLSTLGFVLQTITLYDGSEVSNVWVYDNETGNTPYDTESGPVYFYEPQLYVTNFNQYFVYIDNENV